MKTLFILTILMTSAIGFAGEVETQDGNAVICQAELDEVNEVKVEGSEAKDSGVIRD